MACIHTFLKITPQGEEIGTVLLANAPKFLNGPQLQITAVNIIENSSDLRADIGFRRDAFDIGVVISEAEVTAFDRLHQFQLNDRLVIELAEFRFETWVVDLSDGNAFR